MPEKFATIDGMHLSLEYDKRNAFICIIVPSPIKLKREGKFLHHCAGGTMNYGYARFTRRIAHIFHANRNEAA